MTTTTNYLPNATEERDVKFFREIKNELGITSTQKMIKLVRVVLSHLRRSLSHNQNTDLITRMPALFQLLFISNWKYDEKCVSIAHLDELVENIYEEDMKNGRSLFKSEIDALSSVITVIKSLNKFFGLFSIGALPYSLVHELQQAAQEEAA